MSTDRVRFYVDSYGCAKNQVDSEELIERLARAGFVLAEDAAGADLIIINSCGFIEDAKRESIDAVIGTRARYPNARIMLAGCLAQRYAADLSEELPEADVIFGNADLSRVAEAAKTGSARTLVPPQAPAFPADLERTNLLSFPGCAYVRISEGCSNRCSYCAIPIIRGPHRSRPSSEILDEISSLVKRGIREIVLIGQDLGAYGEGAGGLAGLLRGISRVPGDFRVRPLYIHPDHFPFDILDAMRDDPRILPYFDIPFQHASERILAAMNRKGSPERYLELCRSIRDALPDAVLRSTFLVGFPGEGEEDFAILRRFQDEAKLDWLGAFRYSSEDGTPAHALKGKVSAKVANARVQAIQEAQLPITERALARFVGGSYDCLVEEKIAEEGLCIGRIYAQAPDVDGATVVAGAFEPGTVVKVRILRVNGVDLDAVPSSGS